MNIPDDDKITYRNVMRGHGANGYAVYVDADTLGLGIRVKHMRVDHSWRSEWTLDALPQQRFATLGHLRAAAAALTDEQVAQTMAKWPRITSIKPDVCGNRCQLCPWQPTLGRDGKRVIHDTMRVEIAYTWADVHSNSLCHEHTEQYRTDPPGLAAAFDAEVAERRARSEEFRRKLGEVREMPDDSSSPF